MKWISYSIDAVALLGIVTKKSVDKKEIVINNINNGY